MATCDDLFVALDIGTTQVRATLVEKKKQGELAVVGIGQVPSRGVRRGVVVNIEAAIRSVSEAIELGEQEAGRTVNDLCTTITGGNIEGFNSRGVVAITGRGREITKSDVARVLETARAVVIPLDREIIHVVPQEYKVDDQAGLRNPIDMMGVRLEAEVHIITCSESTSQNIIRCVNRSGYRVNEMVLGSLAVAKAVLTEDEKKLGVLLIDLGGGTTDVLVYLDGAPYHTSVLPLGGMQVTNDLAIMLNIPFEVAEQVKLQSGCCWEPLTREASCVSIPHLGGRPALSVPEMRICRIIQPRMAELLSLVKKQVGKKGYLEQLGGGVVISGGGALLLGVEELIGEIFQGMPVRIGVPPSFKGLKEPYRSPAYTAGIGLAAYAAEKADRSDAESPVTGENTQGWKGLLGWLRELF